MRSVLHVVGDSEYGGGSKIIESLIISALDKGWDVSVLTTDSFFIRRVDILGAKVVNVDCIWRPIKPIKDLFGLIELFKFLKANKYDVVHTHTTKAGLIGRIAARMSSTNVIIHTVHGFAFSENSSKCKIYFYSLIERVASFFCDRIVTVSNYHRQWAINLKIAKESKLQAIPNGIQGISLSEKISRKSNNFNILFVGRLVIEKGILDLVSATSMLKKSGIAEVNLLLVGAGEDELTIQEHIKSLGVENNVEFLGFKDNISTYYENSDIFCLPSYREGLSISLLESMSTGIAIVASDVGGNKEALSYGDSGLLYEAGNIESLFKCLSSLIVDDKLRFELGASAKKRFNSYYHEKIMTDAYLSLYENLYEN